MAYKIGFTTNYTQQQNDTTFINSSTAKAEPRKSVVQVQFPDNNKKLAYYNDLFDLEIGDIVFVDGTMEGKRGRVVDINYNFKIRISDYKRIISVAATDVKGQFVGGGSHFITFDRETLPKDKILTWFKPIEENDDLFIIGYDEDTFRLDDLRSMNVSPTIAERGHDYYIENNVLYLSLDGTKGYALVKGSEIYEVEFEYHNNKISKLICSCFCSYNCKHEFATMLQLQEILEIIDMNYTCDYERTGYFAAVNKATLFAYAIDGKNSGTFTL